MYGLPTYQPSGLMGPFEHRLLTDKIRLGGPRYQSARESADRQVLAGVFVCVLTVFVGWIGYAYRNESPPDYRPPMFSPLLILVFCVGLFLAVRGTWRLRKMGEKSPEDLKGSR
jgi:hypothetical protein